MRITAYGFLIGASVLLASPLTTLPTSLFIQGGALAILGWTVWYMLARAFPAHHKSAREERTAFLEVQEQERADFLKAQENTRREFRESITALAGSLNCLTAALTRRTQD